jgi:cobalt-zinc-cadmium efflux system outer membrane protein
MKKSIQLLLVIIVLSSQLAKSQSLQDYLLEAAENNPGLKASYLEFESFMQKSAQVKAIPDLTLSFGYFVSPVETRVGPQRARFSLVQMFPWFGTNATKVSATEQLAQSKYYAFVDQKNQLYYKVSEAYYPLVELHQHLRFQQENIEILNTYKRLSTTNFANDKGSMVDVLRVDIMIENANTEIALLNSKIRPLEVAFNRLLNRPDSMTVVIQPFAEIDGQEQAFVLDSLLENNPRLRAIEEDKKAAESSRQVAEKQGLPSFGIGLDYAIVGERTDVDIPDNGKDILMPMVTMNLPLFRKKYNSAIQEATLRHQSLEHRKQQVANELVSSYEIENYRILQSVSLLKLYEEQAAKTRQAIDLLYAEYANSGEGFEEVLRMEQQLIKYNLSKVTAAKEYYTAVARLDYLTAKSL